MSDSQAPAHSRTEVDSGVITVTFTRDDKRNAISPAMFAAFCGQDNRECCAHVERTLGWIGRLKPRRAVLTNLHVDLDYRTLERDLPAGVEPAHDGWRIDIPL